MVIEMFKCGCKGLFELSTKQYFTLALRAIEIEILLNYLSQVIDINLRSY